jgi:Natural resistance-associated macrophage protein
LPLSTVFTVCEGLGFESGVDKRFHEAPEFYWLYTLLVGLGAAVILWPNFPLVKMILASQVLNGVLLPFVLIYMVILVNKKGLMKEWTNSAAYNAVAWVSVAIMIGLTLVLASIYVKQLMPQAKAIPPAGSAPVAQVQRFSKMQSYNPNGHAFKANVHESRIAHLIRQTIGIGKFAD